MARYDSLRKPEKKRLIREYRVLHPELSYAEIGSVFSLDPAWVWRICNDHSNEALPQPEIGREVNQ